jgi:hypothetical protein
MQMSKAMGAAKIEIPPNIPETSKRNRTTPDASTINPLLLRVMPEP